MTPSGDLLQQFQKVGSDLYSRGLITMYGGNLSVRHKDGLIITRTGSRLGFLSESDLIETGIDKDDGNTRLASSELPVHRAIYQAAGCACIAHAHSPYAVALSTVHNRIKPTDIEGRLSFPEVPVIGFGTDPVPGALAAEIAAALAKYPIVLVHRHGSFACGKTLREAYSHIEILEYSCHILFLLNQLRH